MVNKPTNTVLQFIPEGPPSRGLTPTKMSAVRGLFALAILLRKERLSQESFGRGSLSREAKENQFTIRIQICGSGVRVPIAAPLFRWTPGKQRTTKRACHFPESLSRKQI